MIDNKAIKPNGTPTPTPIATSLFPFDGDEFDALVDVGSVVAFDVAVSVLLVRFESPARPMIICPESNSKGEPLGQAVESPSTIGVPQQ